MEVIPWPIDVLVTGNPAACRGPDQDQGYWGLNPRYIQLCCLVNEGWPHSSMFRGHLWIDIQRWYELSRCSRGLEGCDVSLIPTGPSSVRSEGMWADLRRSGGY